MTEDVHYDLVRFPCRDFRDGVPKVLVSLDQLPASPRFTIEKIHRRAGYDGPIEIVSAGRLERDFACYEVLTAVCR